MTHKDTDKALARLLKIMRTLRAPDGCPWDAKQTPQSLAPYLLEEACELIDAIEIGSTELILDELGDLLLQVVFQAQIFAEKGQFEFEDVAATIADKLIRRHPHVFNRDNDCDSNNLDKQWDMIKSREENQQKNCLGDHLPNRLPSLQRAQKLISRVCRADLHQHLPATPDHPPQPFNEETLGLALFQLVKQAYDSGLDAETALRKTTRQTMCQIESLETNTFVANRPEPND